MSWEIINQSTVCPRAKSSVASKLPEPFTKQSNSFKCTCFHQAGNMNLAESKTAWKLALSMFKLIQNFQQQSSEYITLNIFTGKKPVPWKLWPILSHIYHFCYSIFKYLVSYGRLLYIYIYSSSWSLTYRCTQPHFYAFKFESYWCHPSIIGDALCVKRMAHTLASVTVFDRRQSVVSVSSCMGKRADSIFLCVLHCPVMQFNNSLKRWSWSFLPQRKSAITLPSW